MVKDKDALIPAFLRGRGVFKNHVDSFNQFLREGLQAVITASPMITSDYDPNYSIKFTKIWVGSPDLPNPKAMRFDPAYPHECRLRDLTYSAPIYVDVECSAKASISTSKQIKIGKMPIMLRSANCVLAQCKTEWDFARYKECPLDPGGYFIARGQEKVILIQEQLAKNRIILEKEKDVIACQVTSSTAERKSRINVVLIKEHFYMRHNSFLEDIPIIVIFRGMGVNSDMEIVQMIGNTDACEENIFLSLNFCHDHGIRTQLEALRFIGSKLRPRKGPRKSPADEARDMLKSSVLHHIPAPLFDFRIRAIYLAIMVRRMIDAINDKSIVDDKDYYGNKRMELGGYYMSLLFEDLFKKFCTNVKQYLDKSLQKRTKNSHEVNMVTLLQSQARQITVGMEMALSSGHWNLSRFKMDRQGISQILSRQSFIAALGMMTRVDSQVEKSRKTSGPRALHASQWGMICPCDTPEGESCGLVKNLALLSQITTHSETEDLERIIRIIGIHDTRRYPAYRGICLYVNGSLIGLVEGHEEFIQSFKTLRRRGCIDCFVSIHYSKKHNSVYVYSDAGRLVRPCIVLYDGKSWLTDDHIAKVKSGACTFDKLLYEGIVEYLDVNEENDALIALTEEKIQPGCTHLEIEQYAILGICASLIPYPNHNQSPRNTYQCAMGKQAMGNIGYNQQKRIDTVQYNLTYAQKPLVPTKALKVTNFEKCPAGHNAVVAVMSYSGFDIEDAIVLNKASLDRGYGRCTVYKQAKTLLESHNRRSHVASDRIMGPNYEQQKDGSYQIKYKDQALEHDGLAAVGAPVERGQTLLQKETPDFSSNTPVHKPMPLTSKESGTFYVDQALIAAGKDDNSLIKFSLRQTRRPEVGDKFSSRHGQKGVTGLIVDQADLPFTGGGIVPDMIMNPHGFPSRMTVGKLIEFIAGKATAIDGCPRDGSAFSGTSAEDICDSLMENGFSRAGKELMYSGTTGEPLLCYIFVGVVYYQKLKHMVADKINVRREGNIQFLTRQPTEGRSKGGGLRVGEMERDCLIGHGVSNLLRERLVLSSDAFQVQICTQCGAIVDSGRCEACRSSQTIKETTLPYAFKLLVQELHSMNISCRLEFENYTK